MSVLDLLFPTYCIGCRKEGKYFCIKCLNKIKVLNSFDPTTNSFSVFAYEGLIKKGIIKIKYSFAYDITKELADLTVKTLKNNFSVKNTVLIPIPLHKKRRMWRGFNQSEILGKLIAENLNWQFEKDVLIRPKGGKTQVGLRGTERVRNIRGKFAVKTSINPNLTYIVFDDVATTGSTIKEAIRKLKDKKAQKVLGFTVAR